MAIKIGGTTVIDNNQYYIGKPNGVSDVVIGPDTSGSGGYFLNVSNAAEVDVKSVALTTNDQITTYDSGGSIKAIFTTIGDFGTPFTGNPITLTGSGSSYFSAIHQISSTQAIVFYGVSGTFATYATVLTVSGTTLSQGTPTIVSSGAALAVLSACSAKIDSSRFFFSYLDDQLEIYSRIVSVSGTTVTANTQLASTTNFYNAAKVVGSNEILCAADDGGLAIVTFTSTSVTGHGPSVSIGAPSGIFDIVDIDDKNKSRVVVAYADSTSGLFGNKICLRTVTKTNTNNTFTLGPVYKPFIGYDTYPPINMQYHSNNRFIFPFSLSGYTSGATGHIGFGYVDELTSEISISYITSDVQFAPAQFKHAVISSITDAQIDSVLAFSVVAGNNMQARIYYNQSYQLLDTSNKVQVIKDQLATPLYGGTVYLPDTTGGGSYVNGLERFNIINETDFPVSIESASEIGQNVFLGSKSSLSAIVSDFSNNKWQFLINSSKDREIFLFGNYLQSSITPATNVSSAPLNNNKAIVFCKTAGVNASAFIATADGTNVSYGTLATVSSTATSIKAIVAVRENLAIAFFINSSTTFLNAIPLNIDLTANTITAGTPLSFANYLSFGNAIVLDYETVVFSTRAPTVNYPSAVTVKVGLNNAISNASSYTPTTTSVTNSPVIANVKNVNTGFYFLYETGTTTNITKTSITSAGVVSSSYNITPSIGDVTGQSMVAQRANISFGNSFGSTTDAVTIFYNKASDPSNHYYARVIYTAGNALATLYVGPEKFIGYSAAPALPGDVKAIDDTYIIMLRLHDPVSNPVPACVASILKRNQYEIVSESGEIAIPLQGVVSNSAGFVPYSAISVLSDNKILISINGTNPQVSYIGVTN